MASDDQIDRSTAEEKNTNPVASANGNGDLQLQKVILWGLFEEHRGHARHSETLRSTVIGMLILASTALVTLATYDKKVNSWDIPAALLLIGFGILGFLFSLYHTEKIVKHKLIASDYGNELDTTVFLPITGGARLKTIGARSVNKESALSEGSVANKFLDLANLFVFFVIEKSEDMKLRSSLILWSILPAFIAAIGLLLFVVALLSGSARSL
jgi:hypothetical protein